MTRKSSAKPDKQAVLHLLWLDPDETHQLSLTHREDEWIVSTSAFRNYTDLQGIVKKTAVSDHELLHVRMHAGELYAYQQHAILAKSSIKQWERDTVTGKKFREICIMFGLIPEELTWNGTFTPMTVGDHEDWKEPIDLKVRPFEEQTEKAAQKIRDLKTLNAYIRRKYPDLDEDLSLLEFSAQRELQDLLRYRSISNDTDPVDIPSWAWKGEPYGRCRARTNKALEDHYVKEGLLEKTEADA